MFSRSVIIDNISKHINSLSGRTLVAMDGVDGSGKTTFADELAPIIEQSGRQVIRSSVDGFHNPRAVRYNRGKCDPHGFFFDSYNYGDLRQFLLDPFKCGADTVDTARFDHRVDNAVKVTKSVSSSAVLLLDGIFLHREELRNCWDFSIFLDVPFAVSCSRMAIRDQCNPDPLSPENHRYYEGQNIYLRTCTPALRASIVIDNSASIF